MYLCRKRLASNITDLRTILRPVTLIFRVVVRLRFSGHVEVTVTASYSRRIHP